MLAWIRKKREDFIHRNSNEIDSYKSEYSLKTLLRVLRFIIVAGIIILPSMLVYFYVTRTKETTVVASEIDPNRDGYITYPYKDVSEFVATSYECKQLSTNDFPLLSKTGYTTLVKDDKKWSMMNVTLLFSFLQTIVEKERNNGLNHFCSTTIGIPDVPCACVLRLSNDELLWVLDVHNKVDLELQEKTPTKYAYVRETPFIFKNMYGGAVVKKIPPTVRLTFTTCIKKEEGLSCKAKARTFEREDVFNWSRLVYFLNFNKQYDDKDPSLGYFEPEQVSIL